MKLSTVGEKAYTIMDSLDTHWKPSGLTYLKDEDLLLSLYQNLRKPKQYRARKISKIRFFEVISDVVFVSDYRIYAITHNNDEYYMLGVDSSGTDNLVVTTSDFIEIKAQGINDSTVVGLCFKDNSLYFSYRDRIIKKIDEF